MRPLLLALLAAGSVLPLAALAARGAGVPEGKQITDRSLELVVLVDAPRQHVYELWTTESGVDRFFGEQSHIEARAGGAYEIYFLPRSHPESDANSSRGARLLSLEPGRALSFEWTAPPFARELNTHPLPTWVEVHLEDAPGHPGRTIVRVSHHGFRRGEPWDQTYEFFVRAWSQVLLRLQQAVLGLPGEIR